MVEEQRGLCVGLALLYAPKGVRPVAIGLALIGLVCSTASALGAVLATLPITPGRLAYYALVAGGLTPRLTAIGAMGCLLAAPTVRHARHARWLSFAAIGAGVLGAGVSAALSAPILWAARSRGQSVSVRASLCGRYTHHDPGPEVVTFASGVGWQLDADLYRPPKASPPVQPVPSVIVVHGGAWRWGDKSDNPQWNQWLARRGYLVLDIQYRLAPAADWRTAVGDIRCAVQWLRTHAAELGADPERVAILGRSAGGHLALLAAYATDEAAYAPPVWCVIAMYAPVHLRRLYADACRTQAHDVREGLCAVLGSTPSTGGEAYRLASPLERVSPDVPPTLLIHGTWDTTVRPEHSAMLAQKLKKEGVVVQLVRVPFARHAFDLVADGLGTQLAQAAVAGFLADRSRR